MEVEFEAKKFRRTVRNKEKPPPMLRDVEMNRVIK